VKVRTSTPRSRPPEGRELTTYCTTSKTAKRERATATTFTWTQKRTGSALRVARMRRVVVVVVAVVEEGGEEDGDEEDGDEDEEEEKGCEAE